MADATVAVTVGEDPGSGGGGSGGGDSGGSGGVPKDSWGEAATAPADFSAAETTSLPLGMQLFAAPEATALAGSGFDGLGEGTVAVETIVPPAEEPHAAANVPFLLFAHDGGQGIDAALR